MLDIISSKNEASVAQPPNNRRLMRIAIVTYYRRRARGSKVTFKEICEQMGLNVASARVAKVAYDKQRRRRPKKD